MEAPAPDVPKPNRRRAVISITVFTIILGVIVHYLWTNNTYFKWRFVGGEVHMMRRALSKGYISPDQVVTLLNAGATDEVRLEALRVMGRSRRFGPPCADSVIAAVIEFAADMPKLHPPQAAPAKALLELVSSFRHPGLAEKIVVMFVSHRDRKLRSHVHNWAMDVMRRRDTSEWAETTLCNLLDNTNPEVRQVAVYGAYALRNGGTGILLSRLRETLDSRKEKPGLRAMALKVLFRNGLIHDGQLATMANSRHKQIAEAAKGLIEKRPAEREKTREGSSFDK